MKKTAEEIQKYYQKEQVVESYKQRRFLGPGGKYIHEGEVAPIVEAIQQELDTRKNVKVLDVASGSGRLTFELLGLDAEIYALDASEEMLKLLEKKVKKSSIFHQSVAEPLPISFSFDVITSLRFFEHFAMKDQVDFLRNLQRHLKPGGTLVYASVNARSFEALFSSFFPYGRYNFFYKDALYKAVFQRLGFTVESRTCAFFIPRGTFLALQKYTWLESILEKIDRALTKAFPGLSSYFVYSLRNTK